MIVALLRRWRLFATLFIILPGAAGGALFGLSFFDYWQQRSEIRTSIAELKERLDGRAGRESLAMIEIYAANSTLMGELLPERGSRITKQSCGQMEWLRHAAVSAEDRYFFDHRGISMHGVARAMWVNLRAMSIRQGAGSITMQLARNLFTEREQTIWRKLFEIYAAFDLERELTKEEILCLYLNEIYMGEGRVGAEEAAWFYYRKPPQQLDAAEAAMIVGLFPSPVRYSPLNNLALSRLKQELVLDAMVRDGHLNEELRQQSVVAFLRRYEVVEEGEFPSPGQIGAYGASRFFRLNHAPTANDYVRQYLYSHLPEEQIRKGGIRVYTTIDLPRQRAANAVVRGEVRAARERMLDNSRVEAAELRRLSRRLQGVLVSLDARSGDILAVVGSAEVIEGTQMTQRVWHMRRQPGSTIKALLYAVAIDEGALSVDSMVVDEAVDFRGYRPNNWYSGFRGEMSLRQAVAMSVNTVAVRTLHTIGVETFRDALGAALGLSYFEARRRFSGELSLALGAGELTPLELAVIHAPLLNEGRSVEPRLILRVEAREAGGPTTLFEVGERSNGLRIFKRDSTPGAALELLRSVVSMDDDGTAGWIGQRQAQSSNYLPLPLAGKSGTVQNPAAGRQRYPNMPGVRDAWFVGFVPGEVTVAWVGHDEGAPFLGGGSSTAGAIWAAYLQSGVRNRQLATLFPDYQPSEQEDAFYADSGADPGMNFFKNLESEQPLWNEDELQALPEPERLPGEISGDEGLPQSLDENELKELEQQLLEEQEEQPLQIEAKRD